MSAITVCRICLSSDLDLHGVRIDLQSVYEGITKEEYNKDGYPLSMCYICLSALRKCHKFMETVRETNNVLKHWYIYNQQNEILAKPLYVHSRSKVEIVSTNDENTFIEIYLKKEKLDVEYDKVQTEYIECDPGVDIVNTDHPHTDIDEPTDIGDFAEDSPDDTFDDSNKDDDSDDVQTDPLSHSSLASNDDEKIRRKKRTKTPHNGTPVKRRKSKASELQHAVPGTSRDTGANSDTYSEQASAQINGDIQPKQKLTGFEEKMMSLLKKIKTQNDEILSQVKQNNVKGILKPEFKFPLKTLDDLNKNEKLLEVEENYENLVSYITSLGGIETSSKVSRIMKLFMSDCLAKDFNFYGKRSDKKPFCQLRLRDCIVDGVKNTSSTVTEKNVEDYIKVWLKHAPERVKNKMLKDNSSFS